MFKIGKDYDVTMIVAVPGNWTDQTGRYTVREVEGTLVKLCNPYSPDLIVNTASWHFVSATEVE